VTGGDVRNASVDIIGTDDPHLYTEQRFGDFAYSLPAADGSYRLQLSFAEVAPQDGRRAFSVSSNGRMLLRSFVITDYVQPYQALVVWLTVEVKGGSLPLMFSSDEGQASLAGLELLRKTTAVSSTTSNTAVPKQTTTTSSPSYSVSSTGTSDVAIPNMDGWELVASDDFNGTSLDTEAWGTYEGPGNAGIGFRAPDHLRVSDGALHIVGIDDTSGGAAFNHHQTYGRFVIRAKQDAGHGYGPALMLWPDSGKWPEDGEIDIAEMPEGDAKTSHFTLHWGKDNSQDGHTTYGNFDEWHTWTVEWMPDHITYWLDGVQQHTFDEPGSIPSTSMHFAVQNDVGDATSWIANRNADTPREVATHIDVVRAYAAVN
jgi:beta-glucanase (GH16 family)